METNAPVTLGFLANVYDEPFADSPTNGFLGITRDLNARIIMFPYPHPRYSPGADDKRNLLLKLLDPSSLDGLIISGFFSHGVDAGEFRRFCEGFAPLPTVTLGVEVPGTSSVLTDAGSGMRQLLTHLLDDHGYDRIAFLGGPEGQQEAEARLGVYREALAARGIPFRPEWVFSGDFSYESGLEVARRLVDGGRPPFQGLVCANDSMALAVQAVLTQAGYRIPEDLFLTGFDDYHAQTLSTVKQSPFLQMRSAVELLLDRVRNGAPPRTVTIPAVPVVRSSCGCLPEARFDRYRREHQADTAYADRLDRLQKAFVASVRSPGSRTFVLELDTVLGDPAVGEPEDFWRSLEQSMRNRCLGTLAAEGRRDEAEHLLALGRFLAEERNLGLKSESLHVVSRQAFQLRETAEALGNSRTIQETFDLVARELPPLGVRACWLSLLDDASLQSSTLRLAFDEGGRVDLPADGVRFPSRQLIPGGCRSIGTGHWLLFAEVLQAKDEVFGVLVLSVTLQGASLCEALRSHISVAIQGAKLWEDRDRNERRIIENEKMSALGALVAGVAHEINTPLGNGIMAASDLRDRVADLIRRSQEDRLSREGFAKALADLEEESRLIESNLARAGDLVSSFKQVAVDQTYEESRWFSLADYLRYIVLSHKSKLKPGNHRCQWDCPPEIALFGPPGTLAQVVSNLIENAVSHGFEGRQGGTIRITCFQEEGRVHITVADDGVGIPPSQTGRIFEPFYTTKRGRGGTGLGLAIVHNLVRKVWNGTLECSSVVGQGTEFRLTLPVPDPLR